MEKYVPYLVTAVLVWGFFCVLFVASRLVRPNRSGALASQAFSSGETPRGLPWIRTSPRYQTVLAIAALFFLGVLIFYPAAVVFRRRVEEGHGVSALLEVIFFLGTLAIALAYAWMKGDLGWIRDVERRGSGGE